MKNSLLLSLAFATLIFLVSGCYSDALITSEEVSYEDIERIEVDGVFCNITLESSSPTGLVELYGEIRGNGNAEEYHIRHERRGKKLIIWIEKPSLSFGIYGNLTLKVPEIIDVDLSTASGNIEMGQTNGKVQLVTGSGEILVETANGKVKAESASGNINLQNVRGDVRVMSESGNIDLSEIDGDLNARAASGNINLSSTSGNLDVESASGNISGDNVSVKGKNHLKSASGNIEIDLNHDLDEIGFVVRSSSGNIEVGEYSTNDVFEQDGRGLKIRARSESGNVTFR